jgi:hypothetical protein
MRGIMSMALAHLSCDITRIIRRGRIQAQDKVNEGAHHCQAC